MKSWLLLTAMMLLLSAGHSQRLKTDSICLPATQLKAALKKIEEGRLAVHELTLVQRENLLLQKSMTVKDSIAAIQQHKEQTYRLMVQNVERENVNLQQQVTVMTHQLKKQKRKTFFTGLGGLLATLGLGYLVLK